MNPEIEKLIELTVATGEITEKKRETIMRRAKILGEDLDEVELILNGELALSKNNKSINNTADVYEINKNKQVVNISLYQIILSFFKQHKLLKYSAIFFLVCLTFFLFSLLLLLLM